MTQKSWVEILEELETMGASLEGERKVSPKGRRGTIKWTWKIGVGKDGVIYYGERVAITEHQLATIIAAYTGQTVHAVSYGLSVCAQVMWDTLTNTSSNHEITFPCPRRCSRFVPSEDSLEN